MWDEQKRLRFQELRQRELAQALTEAERAELTLLVEELEAEEARYLKPATEKLQQEREAIESRNRALEALVSRKEALVARLRKLLAETQAERQAIESELAAILAGNQVSE